MKKKSINVFRVSELLPMAQLVLTVDYTKKQKDRVTLSGISNLFAVTSHHE